MKKYENYTKEQLIQKIKQLESKKYGLVWDDEKEPEKVVQECQNNIPILKKVDEKTIKTDIKKPTNILIEGDNYHALQVLNYTHKGQIDVIYIDPPYNTGNKDFKYNDSFVDREDGYRHSKWLNFMSKRLKLAHNLLKDNGVIFISIDDNEIAQLKLLCDDIFDEKNSLNPIIWHKKTQPSYLSTEIINVTEYILSYKKTSQKLVFKAGTTNPNKHIELLNKSNSLQLRKFFNNVIIGKNFSGTLEKGLYGNGDLKINILNDINVYNGKPQNEILIEGRFKWSQERIDEYVKDGSIVYFKSIKTMRATLKANNNNEKIKPPISILSKYVNEAPTNTDATNDLKNMFNGISPMDYPKPQKLIKNIINSIVYNKPNSTILDFFAGSGTTGHAVLELNKEDGGNRQFILCTNNENSICEEVTYPRISKVINGYTTPKNIDVDGLGGNLDYYKTDLIPTNGISNITDTTREELTKKAGNMIAIKENTHYMLELCEHYQIFINETTKKQTAIYFTEDLSCFDELIEKTKSHFTKLYIFSFGKIDKSSYKYLGKNYQIEDIPEPIIEIYKDINKEGIL